MEHPLISNIDNLSVDELQQRISDLNKKLQFAMRTNNGHLAGQLRMALETFNNKYRQRLQEDWDSKQGKGTDYTGRIDIS